MKAWYYTLVFLFTAQLLGAQAYRTAGGIRLGTDLGFSLQYNMYKSLTIEGILQKSFIDGTTSISVLLEQHDKIIFKSLNVYWGGGLHKGWSSKNSELDTKSPFGLTGIIGVELTLGRYNFSFDYKPAMNLSGGTHFWDSQTAFTVRYVFVKKKKKFKLF